MSSCKVMVCVTGQKNCERLIREGARVAREHDGSVSVIHVACENSDFLHHGIAPEAEALEHLFRCAQACGAEMSVLRSKNALETLTRFAHENAITCAVLGAAQGAEAFRFSDQLRAALPGVDVLTVYGQDEGRS